MSSDVKAPCVHPQDVSSTPTKSRKRTLQQEHDDDGVIDFASKRHRPELPLTSPSASSKFKARKQLRKNSSQSEPKLSKRLVATDLQTNKAADCHAGLVRERRRTSSAKPENRQFPKTPPNSDSEDPRQSSGHLSDRLVENWLEKSVQEKVESTAGILTSITRPASPQFLEFEAQEFSDQKSPQGGITLPSRSRTPTQSGRLNASSSFYLGMLKMSGVIIDVLGTEIPADVQKLVDEHILKEHDSPLLGKDEKTDIMERIEENWNEDEAKVRILLDTLLFPLRASGICRGGDSLWSTKPLPWNPAYPYRLPAPKTDFHIGFPTTFMSTWTTEELGAADSPEVQPYSQPTRSNLFPSFLIEVKSEATGGTLHSAEGQLAVAGAHRVRSMMWMLDYVEPSRKASSADALIFSAAVSQREASAYVHYYNPQDERIYMSCIGCFPFMKDIQGCHNYSKNVIDWLLNIQQPLVRELLTKMHPLLTVSLQESQPDSNIAATDAAESTSENGRHAKRQRTLEG